MKQLIVLAFLISAVASAQTTRILQQILTKDSCTDPTPISGILITSAPGAHVVAMMGSGISSTATCGTYTNSPGAPPFPNVQVDNNGNLIGLTVMELMPQTACTPAGAASSPNWQYLCLYNSGNTSQLLLSLSYQYDTTPWVLEIGTPVVGDEQVTLPITDAKSKNGALYQVCYGENLADTTAFVTDTTCASPFTLVPNPSTANPIVVKNLKNGTAYIFKVRGIDANKKVLTDTWSAPSTPATPIQIESFPEWYNGKPNYAMNCSQGSTSTSAFTLWAFLGFILLSLRKSKNKKISLVVTTLILLSTPSMARFGQLNVGITGSPYLPNIDGSQAASGSGTINPLYRCMFNNKILPLMGLHVDGQMFDSFGTLTLGVAAAYTYASGFGTTAVNPDCSLAKPTPVAAGLHILHLKPQLTYILDNWIDTFPIAPYIKVAVVGAGYLFTFQGEPDNPRAGDTTHPNGKPLGVVFGWEAAAGLMISLDWIQPIVSANARGLGTYDHTYLRLEAAYTPINNFGQGGLDFSNAWPDKKIPLNLTASLMVEFQ